MMIYIKDLKLDQVLMHHWVTTGEAVSRVKTDLKELWMRKNPHMTDDPQLSLPGDMGGPLEEQKTSREYGIKKENVIYFANWDD